MGQGVAGSGQKWNMKPVKRGGVCKIALWGVTLSKLAISNICIGFRIMDIDQTSRANVIGMCWMIFAMACFALEDTFLKLVLQVLPVGQLLIVHGIGGVIVFGIILRMQNQPLFIRDVFSIPMRVRLFFELMGRVCYTAALALVPLSAMTAILQATPIVVVASAVILFGEKIGPRRWFAIALGLLGVMIIIRPTSDQFTIYSVLAIFGMFGFAGRDLASRAAPKTISTALLGFYGFITVFIAGVIITLSKGGAFVSLTTSVLGGITGSVVFGVAAYVALMKAMRTGEVSAVTPFRYTRIVFGLACGVLFFGETLDGYMLLGSALVVLSGLFILHRSRG
jgi:drug/metabolite transporter (DMT)-like permease